MEKIRSDYNDGFFYTTRCNANVTRGLPLMRSEILGSSLGSEASSEVHLARVQKGGRSFAVRCRANDSTCNFLICHDNLV